MSILCSLSKKYPYYVKKKKKKNYAPLLKKAKLAREISDGKNEIPHKFLSRKI